MSKSVICFACGHKDQETTLRGMQLNSKLATEARRAAEEREKRG